MIAYSASVLGKVELLPGRTTVGRLVAKLSYNTSYEIYFDSLSFKDVMGIPWTKQSWMPLKLKLKMVFIQM